MAPLAPATEERHRRFLVAFFNHLVNGQAIDLSPMKAFRKPKEDHTINPDKAIRLFEDADLQAILIPRHSSAGRRNRSIGGHQ